MKKNKTLAVLLMIALLFAGLAVPTQREVNAETKNPGIIINGVTLTDSGNLDTETGTIYRLQQNLGQDGSITYDTNSKVLTLENISMERNEEEGYLSNHGIYIYDTEVKKIEVVGDNSLVANANNGAYGISFEYDSYYQTDQGAHTVEITTQDGKQGKLLLDGYMRAISFTGHGSIYGNMNFTGGVSVDIENSSEKAITIACGNISAGDCNITIHDLSLWGTGLEANLGSVFVGADAVLDLHTAYNNIWAYSSENYPNGGRVTIEEGAQLNLQSNQKPISGEVVTLAGDDVTSEFTNEKSSMKIADGKIVNSSNVPRHMCVGSINLVDSKDVIPDETGKYTYVAGEDSYASYEPSSRVLTLHNYAIEDGFKLHTNSTPSLYGILSKTPYSVVLEGKNSIKNVEMGMEFDSPVSFTGRGELDIDTTVFAFHAPGTIIVDGKTQTTRTEDKNVTIKVPSEEVIVTPTATPVVTQAPVPTQTPTPTSTPVLQIPTVTQTPTTTPTAPTQAPEKKGEVVTVSTQKYTVTSTAEDKKTVSFSGTTKKKSRSLTIPTTVSINNEKYKVTSITSGSFQGDKSIKTLTVTKNITTIGANAFKNCKNLKTITIKSKNIKSISKNAFAGINKKAVIKVPASKYKKYVKLLKKANLPKTVKIKKA